MNVPAFGATLLKPRVRKAAVALIGDIAEEALEGPNELEGRRPTEILTPIRRETTADARIFTVERSIAYAYVPAVSAEPGRQVEVEIFGGWVGGEVAPEPLFDPAGERLRG